MLAQDLPERRPVGPWVVQLQPPPLTAFSAAAAHCPSCRFLAVSITAPCPPFQSISVSLGFLNFSLAVSPLPCPLSRSLTLTVDPALERHPFVVTCLQVPPASPRPTTPGFCAGVSAGAHSGDSCTGVLAARRRPVDLPGGASHGVWMGQSRSWEVPATAWRCQSRSMDGSAKAFGGVGHGLGRCQSRPKGVSAPACGVPFWGTFLVRFCAARVRWLVKLQGASRGRVPHPRPQLCRRVSARRGGSGQTSSRRAVLAMLLLAPSPRHALDASDGPLRGFRVRRVAGGGAADGHARQHGRAAGHGPRRAQGAAAHAAPAPHRCTRPLSSLLRSMKITPQRLWL